MGLTIAIDGPVGAGKSTIAGELAKALGILHLDTGAMYRALALKALREGIDPEDAERAEALAERTHIDVRLEGGAQRTLLDGEDVTGQIRTPQVSAAAAAISKAPGVRDRMVALQQGYAATADMVVDGRDIGTRVLPGARFKFFLSATPQERARRRHAQLLEKGMDSDYEKVLEELITRDAQDMGRAVDPLRRAEDAVEVDTTRHTQRQVVDILLRHVKGGCA